MQVNTKRPSSFSKLQLKFPEPFFHEWQRVSQLLSRTQSEQVDEFRKVLRVSFSFPFLRLGAVDSFSAPLAKSKSWTPFWSISVCHDWMPWTPWPIWSSNVLDQRKDLFRVSDMFHLWVSVDTVIKTMKVEVVGSTTFDTSTGNL